MRELLAMGTACPSARNPAPLGCPSAAPFTAREREGNSTSSGAGALRQVNRCRPWLREPMLNVKSGGVASPSAKHRRGFETISVPHRANRRREKSAEGPDMRDDDCTTFLQWALPKADLHWPGFRKVRGQVCKRLRRRMTELGLEEFSAYRARLETDPSEWLVFNECCHITISRFFRDKQVFEHLRSQVLPTVAERARRDRRVARVWSAGCASGEEPYTVRILWDLEIAPAYSNVRLSIVATDIDETMLARARDGCFEATSLRELPLHLLTEAFDQVGNLFCVRSRHREGIEFLNQDLRKETPESLFDIVLCRNLALTYFSPTLRRKVLARVLERLVRHGFLVVGSHEKLPEPIAELAPLPGALQIFEKTMGSNSF